MARNYTLKAAAPVNSTGAVSSSPRNAGKPASSLERTKGTIPANRVKTETEPTAVGPFPAVKARNAESGAESARSGADSGLVICGISHRGDAPNAGQTEKNRFLKFIYSEAPVVGFRVMKRDVVTVRAARDPDKLAERLVGCTRGKIEYLSMESRRRLALVAANTPVVFKSFVTVTYPASFPCDGRTVKKHLDALLKALRRRCRGVEYLWFLEFQRRGAPHFHLFLSVALPEPLSPLNRKCGRVRKVVQTHRPWQLWLSETWYRIVGSGDEKHLRAGSAWEVIEKPDGCASYVAKEAYKTFQKVVPPAYQSVGRFWGTSRGVPPDEGQLVYASQETIQRIFGDGACDADGNPFPVMFGAAVEYEKIRDTPADPVKVNAWKRGAPQKDMISTLGSQSLTGCPLPSGWLGGNSNVSRKIGESPFARDSWHGSTLTTWTST